MHELDEVHETERSELIRAVEGLGVGCNAHVDPSQFSVKGDRLRCDLIYKTANCLARVDIRARDRVHDDARRPGSRLGGPRNAVPHCGVLAGRTAADRLAEAPERHDTPLKNENPGALGPADQDDPPQI